MLVLSRKAGESIRIGENIVIGVRSVTNNRVKLYIEAPQDVRILRSEVLHRLGGADSPKCTSQLTDQTSVEFHRIQVQ